MNLLQLVTGNHRSLPYDPDDAWSVAGNVYYGVGQALNGEEAPNPGEYLSVVQRIYKDDGPIFALMALRQLVFSEARFQWQKLRDGRPGDLVGTKDLRLLEEPWPNGTTGDLLSRMITHADVEGNAFVARLEDQRDRLRMLRPDWVTVIMGSNDDPEMFGDALDAEIIGYAYHPRGRDIGAADIILPENMAHFAPLPDPEFQFRGMSWVQSIVRAVMGDLAATTHKIKFFENGATSSTYVVLDSSIDPDKVKRFRALFEEQHRGVHNAYKTIIMGGGADVRALGADLRQLDFKATQGAGETRMAAVAGVPASIVGFSEGMQGSSLNAGNYTSARRRFADMTMRPLWRMAAAALQNVVDMPTGMGEAGSGLRLWYDDRDIPFLREDRDVVAQIQARQAETIAKLFTAGYTPDSIVEAVVNENWRLLKHDGRPSVQVQETTDPAATQPVNGTAPANGQVKVKIGAAQ